MLVPFFLPLASAYVRLKALLAKKVRMKLRTCCECLDLVVEKKELEYLSLQGDYNLYQERKITLKK